MKRARGHGVMRARELRPKGDGGVGAGYPLNPKSKKGDSISQRILAGVAVWL